MGEFQFSDQPFGPNLCAPPVKSGVRPYGDHARDRSMLKLSALGGWDGKEGVKTPGRTVVPVVGLARGKVGRGFGSTSAHAPAPGHGGPGTPARYGPCPTPTLTPASPLTAPFGVSAGSTAQERKRIGQNAHVPPPPPPSTNARGSVFGLCHCDVCATVTFVPCDMAGKVRGGAGEYR